MQIAIAHPSRRIAVIGGGISGMSAAHFLSRDPKFAGNHVTLIESKDRLGGHARTVTAGKNGDQPVDTGFIVFNRATYPHLCALFDALQVPIADSNMSFAASIRGGQVEYGLASLDVLFAQRRNLVSPAFLRMCRDIVHFNANAPKIAAGRDLTIGQLLVEMGTGPAFRDHYITPFSGAIWSTPTVGILDFPADALVRFFVNHGLMGLRGQHQWYTVRGGSVEYVNRLAQVMRKDGVDLRLGTTVTGLRRDGDGVDLRVSGGEWERFDDVVMAGHSDGSLGLLSDATEDERANLGAVRYQPNKAVLHADPSVMPTRRKCWSSWNYVEPKQPRTDRIDLTYWMNRLQPIPESDPLFITLNANRAIKAELIYDEVTFRHPVYDRGAVAAQSRIKAANGRQNTWFCGAWMGNGFHEDGIASAHAVAQAMLARTADRVLP
jgi:predicted NAD/FAD-binding protein